MLAHSHGSRFAGPATGTLHAQRRGASPPKNFTRRIRVGMVAVPAGDALEHRLALAGSGVNDTAGRAGLRAVCGRHSNDLSATFLHLVGEQPLKLAPASVEDGVVQPGFLPDVAAGVSGRTSSASGHGLGVQVFQHCDAKAIGNVQSGAMVEVPSDAGLHSLQTSDALLGFPATTGSTLATRSNTLRLAAPALNVSKARGQRQHLTIGESERCRDTAINPYAINTRLNLCLLDFAGERDVPPEIVKDYGRIFDGAADLTGVTELDPAYALKPHLRPFCIQYPDSDFSALVSEAIANTLLSRLGERGLASEEGSEGFFQIAQSLLKTGSLHLCDPWKLLSDLANFNGLGCRTDILLVNAPVMAPPVASLFKRYVIDVTTRSRELPKQAFLLRARAQSKPISSVHLHAVDSTTTSVCRQNVITTSEL